MTSEQLCKLVNEAIELGQLKTPVDIVYDNEDVFTDDLLAYIKKQAEPSLRFADSLTPPE